MEKQQRIFIVAGLLLALLIAGVVGFFVIGGSSSSGSSDSGSSTIFIIMISQIPIWVSLGVASREKRKKKDAEGRKRKEKPFYSLEEEYHLEDKVLSAYDGEIVGYDELEDNQFQMKR